MFKISTNYKAFRFVLINSKGQVLLQKRSANKEIDVTKLKLQEEEVSEVRWIDKNEIIEKIKDNYNGITDKEGCWEYLIKYYEWLEKQ